MHVKGLIWLGLRTTQFEEMAKFFRDVMGMQPIRDEPELAGFQLTNGTQLELYRPEEEFHAFFTTGPVVAFQVDDVDAARATMEAAGIEFIGPIQRAGKTSWNHFRAPDGTVFEIMSRADVSTIADWRATLLRIASFREAVITMDRLGATENRIEIATPKGCTTLSERHVEIRPGERVLIVGESGSGKTMLFQAIAGLWPWGSGRIALPSSNSVMFVPRHPYVPLGTLRGALAYPSPETADTDEQIIAALQSAGLNRLSSSLDRISRWDRELTEDEQQCLVFTRLLLRKPRWVVIDEALHALEDNAHQRMIGLFRDGLKDAAVINIGRPEAKNPFFKRVLHLIKDPHGRCFIPKLSVAFADQLMAVPSDRLVNPDG